MEVLFKSMDTGRYACLGFDVLNLLGSLPPAFNVQKGRVDYLLDIIANPDNHARTIKVDPFMARMDIVPLIAQEEHFLSMPKHPPSFVYMDSYSELTDQLFIHKNKQWKFCCNYTDLNHSAQFSQLFDKSGLLPLEELEGYYRCFFKYIRETYGNVPIIFLHFPVKLDRREKFKTRHRNILSIVNTLAKAFQPFYSITVADDIVDWPEERPAGLENFPYHYNAITYKTLAAAVLRTGVISQDEC